MKKTLLFDAEKCTGCRICEMACSLTKEAECNPAKSRIHVIKFDEAGLDAPIACVHCDTAFCEKVCPVKAIYRDPKTDAIEISSDLCIGCRMCVMACPFGAISEDMEKKAIIKCDLCAGNPKCVEFCPTGALQYMPLYKSTLIKKRKSAEKYGELTKKLVTSPQ